jgi:hypothetical protein
MFHPALIGGTTRTPPARRFEPDDTVNHEQNLQPVLSRRLSLRAMRYTVRTPTGGELQFEGIEQLRTSFRTGLIDPDDEVREGDAERWVKARSVPVLAMAMDPRARRARKGRPSLALYALVTLLGVSLILLFSEAWPAGLALAAIASVMLTRLIRRTTQTSSAANLRNHG